MKRFIVPYLVACGDDISAQFSIIEAESKEHAVEIFTFRNKEDGELVFSDEHQIYDEEDYLLINTNSIEEI